jgi:hypothetical protein
MIGQVAARLARIAGWELDAATRMMRYTEEMKAILAVQDVGPLLFEQSLKNVDEADQERIATVIEACLTEGRAFDEHMGVTDGDGEHKWLRTIGEPERAPDGTIIGAAPRPSAASCRPRWASRTIASSSRTRGASTTRGASSMSTTPSAG